jgi:hypothetical protein
VNGSPTDGSPTDGTPTNGSWANGSRANGFIRRELPQDGRPTNGAAPDAPGRGGAGGDIPSPYARSSYDGYAVNGSGFASDGPAGYDAPAADTHVGGVYPNGSYADGSYTERSYAEGSYTEGSYTEGSYTVGSWHDGPTVNRSYRDGAGSEGPAPAADRFDGSYDPWSFDVEPPAPRGPTADDPARRPFAGPDTDLGRQADGGEIGRIEASVWAALARGGSHPSSGLAADGSDDWTLPLPVVRPEPVPPEPEPDRPAPYPGAYYSEARPEALRGRRAYREAEERVAEERWTPDRWDADRWSPGRPAQGAHSTERPRHTRGHREPVPTPDEYSPRAARRRSRRAEEHDDVRGDLAGHADRARHRRLGH